MKLVITGASGFVGQEVIPRLLQSGAELLLVGRDPERLRRLYPDNRITSYHRLAQDAAGFDALLHLAVMNNDQRGSLEAFRETNVVFLQQVLDAARAAGIKTFINITTLHALQGGNRSAYGLTKREAEALLSRAEGIAVVNLRLPAVYGATFKGRLAALTRLPRALRPAAFQLLAALKPTVHASRVADAVLAAAQAGQAADRIVSDRQTGNRVYHAVKRALDIGFSLFVIVVLWWVLAAAWLAVKLTSPGPAIFAQQRVGKGGQTFTCYKFRTMAEGTRQAGTHELTGDSVTRVGRFLRKTKIDELPQVWNILRNELSLVGPRPCLPVQQELIDRRRGLGVLDSKGGITGWAQIRNVDMSDPERLARLDADYLALRTIPLDLRIILATATGSGQGDKVSR